MNAGWRRSYLFPTRSSALMDAVNVRYGYSNSFRGVRKSSMKLVLDVVLSTYASESKMSESENYIDELKMHMTRLSAYVTFPDVQT